MSNKTMPWFRMYSNAVDNDKLRLLAFEDRWHFMALCCCMSQGIQDGSDDVLVRRRLAVKLGLQSVELENLERRLREVDLIDSGMIPKKWEERQFQSDSSSERTKKYRERKKAEESKGCEADDAVTDVKRHSDAIDTDTDTDTDTEKVKSVCAKTAPLTASPKKEKVGLSVDDLVAKGVERQTAVDWFVVRRDKRSSTLTVTALQAVEAQALEAGLSLDAAVRACVEAGWVGFKASWWRNREGGGGAGKAGAVANKAQSIEDANNRLMREMEEKYA